MTELHALRCDHCGVQAELRAMMHAVEGAVFWAEEHFVAPPGWFEVQVQAQDTEASEIQHTCAAASAEDPTHFCSARCLSTYYAPKQTDEIPEAFRRI